MTTTLTTKLANVVSERRHKRIISLLVGHKDSRYPALRGKYLALIEIEYSLRRLLRNLEYVKDNTEGNADGHIARYITFEIGDVVEAVGDAYTDYECSVCLRDVPRIARHAASLEYLKDYHGFLVAYLRLLDPVIDYRPLPTR